MFNKGIKGIKGIKAVKTRKGDTTGTALVYFVSIEASGMGYVEADTPQQRSPKGLTGHSFGIKRTNIVLAKTISLFDCCSC